MTLMLVLICLGYVFQLNGYVDFGPATEILPYSIPVLTLFWLIWLGTYLAQGRKKKTATIIFREKVASLDAFYAGLNETFNLQAADPIKAISEAGTRKEALEISIDNLRGTINLFSDGKGLSNLENTKVELEAEVSQINKELEPLVEFASAAGKIAELKEELTAKRVRCNVLRERAALLTELSAQFRPTRISRDPRA